jgi:fibro-slime domain-containing protein
MPEPIASKPTMNPSRRLPTALLASCLALPALVLVVPGCGDDSGSSRIGNAGSGNTAASGNSTSSAGGGFIPIQGGMDSGTGGTGSGNANGNGGSAPYMLPADYTKATKGGFKLGPAVDLGEAGAPGTGEAGAPGAGGASSGCGTAILGVVRDFKGKNEMGGHPDFEAYSGVGASKGIVKATLGDDQKPVYNGTGPIVDAKNGPQTTSKMDFDSWYRATDNVNKPYLVYFYFEPNNGVLTFQSTAFYPLDGKGWGNTPGSSHNFGFTTEVHTQFTYKGGETFSFTGDDDLWVFINHKLAIDLGGLHPQTNDTILLDRDAAKLGITVGQVYDLDLFHAERHTNESNFRVDTNLAFTNCGTIIEEPPVK